MESWEYHRAQDLHLRSGESVKSIRREVGLPGVLLALMKRPVLQLYLKGFHGLRINGKQNLPDRYPFVLVSNHSSHLDAVILSSLVPVPLSFRLFPIAAGDTFFESFVTSALASWFMNALPLWRRKVVTHSIESLRERVVSEPCGYIVFPEGTRTRTGFLNSFKPGVGKLVAGQDVPIIPCFIDGAFEALPSHRRFPYPKKISIEIGEAFRPEQVPNSKQGWLYIASELQKRIESLSTKQAV